MTTRRQARGAAKVADHALLLALVVFSVFPVFWMVSSSFKGEGEIYGPGLVPMKPTTANFASAFADIPLWRMLVNSGALTLGQTALQLLTSVFASYALSRWKFKGSSAVFAVYSLSWLVPIQTVMIPNYSTIISWGLRGSVLGMMLPSIASSFAVLSLYRSFNSFPTSLYEAATIDGSSDLGILFKIVLPNMGAPLASLGILLLINSWNDYLWPALVATKFETAPIQVGLRAFVSVDSNQWGTLMAATTISCLPVFIVYMILQQKVVDSFMKWGVK